MLNLILKLFIFLLVNSLFNATTYASDLAKEQRMREQIEDYILQGDAVLLDANGHEFLSIYMQAEPQPESSGRKNSSKGAIIIMHGRGYHPDWPELVYPLRTRLPESGWDTLSIQMPVLDNSASFYDYLKITPETYPRINAAIKFLQQKNIHNIILLAHSCSVHMSIDWLHKHPNAGVTAYIGIGMGSVDTGQPMLQPFPLKDIKIPVLDIRGENDYPSVINNAADRWAQMKLAGNDRSAQKVVKNADHYFTSRGEALVKEVADWLDTL